MTRGVLILMAAMLVLGLVAGFAGLGEGAAMVLAAVAVLAAVPLLLRTWLHRR